LLRGEPGVDLAEEVRRRPERLRQLLSHTVSGFADACLWLVRGGAPFPALVYDRGDEIHAHLLEWAENDPPAWFTLYLTELPQGDDDAPGYLVVLQPRIDRSVGRFKAAFPAGLLEGVPVEVVYSPLYFVATGTSYRDLKDRIGGSSLLGLVAARDFRPDRPESLDPQRVLPLGPFPIRDISELGGAEAFLQRASRATVGNERA
jgi:hypothetical protein